MRAILLVLSALWATLSAGCGFTFSLAKPPARIGSGVLATQNRSVSEFRRIELKGAADILVTVG